MEGQGDLVSRMGFRVQVGASGRLSKWINNGDNYGYCVVYGG